jgi:hypothetical protein
MSTGETRNVVAEYVAALQRGDTGAPRQLHPEGNVDDPRRHPLRRRIGRGCGRDRPADVSVAEPG